MSPGKFQFSMSEGQSFRSSLQMSETRIANALRTKY
jgi:hypothetical protein